MFEKDLRIGRLLDFYGTILSDRKQDVMELYYNEDLSLAEIAEDIGISRQGVRELIKKSESELLFYEEKLGLAEIFDRVNNYAQQALRKLPADSANEEARKLIEELADLATRNH